MISNEMRFSQVCIEVCFLWPSGLKRLPSFQREVKCLIAKSRRNKMLSSELAPRPKDTLGVERSGNRQHVCLGHNSLYNNCRQLRERGRVSWASNEVFPSGVPECGVSCSKSLPFGVDRLSPRCVRNCNSLCSLRLVPDAELHLFCSSHCAALSLQKSPNFTSTGN